MVKPPRVKHSKTEREPVTIELEPGAVSRITEPKPEAPVNEAEEAVPAQIADLEPSTSATAKPDSEKTVANRPDADKPHAEKATEAAAVKAETSKPGPSATASATPPRPDRLSAGFDPGSSFDGDAAKPQPKGAPFTGGQGFGREPGRTTPTEPAPRRETPQGAVPPKTPQQSSGGRGVIAGLIGGVAALALGGGLQFAGILPAPVAGSADAGSIATLQGDIAALRQEVAGLKDNPGAAGIDDLQKAVTDSTARIGDLAAGLDQIKGDVAKLRSAVESGGAGDSAAVEALAGKLREVEAAVAALGSGNGEASTAAINALTEKIGTIETAIGAVTAASTANEGRLAALEKSVGEMAGKIDAAGNQPKVALAIAAAALKAAIDRGGTFTAEVETFAAVAPESPDLPALREFAAKGVATRAEIVAAAPDAADAIVASEQTIDPNAGFLDRLWASAESLVQVRPIGEVEGEGVPAVVARMEAALKQGNFAKALQEFDTLPEPQKAAGAAFGEMVRTRIAVEALVEKALSGALKAA